MGSMAPLALVVIKRPDVCAWLGAGGEAYLQALLVGPGAAKRPLVDGMVPRQGQL